MSSESSCIKEMRKWLEDAGLTSTSINSLVTNGFNDQELFSTGICNDNDIDQIAEEYNFSTVDKLKLKLQIKRKISTVSNLPHSPIMHNTNNAIKMEVINLIDSDDNHTQRLELPIKVENIKNEFEDNGNENISRSRSRHRNGNRRDRDRGIMRGNDR
eukprot:509535_1